LGSAYQTARAEERAAAEAQSRSAAAQHAYESVVVEHVVALVQSNGLARMPPEALAALLNRWAEEARDMVERSLGEIESSSVSARVPGTIETVVRTSVNVGTKKKSALIAARMKRNGRSRIWSGRCSPETISELRAMFGDRVDVREVCAIHDLGGSPVEAAECSSGSATELEADASPAAETTQTRSASAEVPETDPDATATTSDAASAMPAQVVAGDFARRTLPRRPGVPVFATAVSPGKTDPP